MEIADRVRAFIMTNFYQARKFRIADEDSLLDRGIVDSTGVLELVAYLEAEFGLAIADDDIVPDNMDSIGSIGRFIQRKLAKAT
jgi:acyl carrier protein